MKSATLLRYLMWVLWPSFLAAGAGTGVVFTLLDPAELVVLGQSVGASRNAVYTVGFFILWALCALACALSVFLQAGSRQDESAPAP